MKSKTFILTEHTRQLIVDTVMHSAADGRVQVTISNATEIRRTAQNALVWAGWYPELSNQTGYTEEELHEKFKRTYMLRIYLASQENARQIEWVSLYNIIKADGTDEMIERALCTISTTWATVFQYTEYLKMIEKFCQSKDLKLPAHPDYAKAMGQ